MPNNNLTSIAELQERYGVKRSAIYGRMAALGLKPTKVKHRSFVTAADVQQLDAFAKHLKVGGTINNFEGPTLANDDNDVATKDAADLDPTKLDEEEVDSEPAIALTPSANLAPANQTDRLAALLDLIANRQPLTHPVHDLTARLELLEKAAAHKWLLPTSELADAVGVSPQSIGAYSKFERYGFRFTQSGQHGSETAWSVTKHSRKKKKAKR